jgi:hypothetical protein
MIFISSPHCNSVYINEVSFTSTDGVAVTITLHSSLCCLGYTESKCKMTDQCLVGRNLMDVLYPHFPRGTVEDHDKLGHYSRCRERDSN